MRFFRGQCLQSGGISKSVPVRRKTVKMRRDLFLALGALSALGLGWELGKHAVGEVSPVFVGVVIKLESPMRRRRSRALASDVDDLIGQYGSSTEGAHDSTAEGHAGGFCPAVMQRPPYLDVQTVKTNLTVDQAAKLEVGFDVWKQKVRRQPWLIFATKSLARFFHDS